jgi:hypothetical protein
VWGKRDEWTQERDPEREDDLRVRPGAESSRKD